ncbi:ESPR-type extended signal peptide-containing protein [Caballeronia novacaledonica]|uniref:ESPR-type extended signal peptide-containing protein n=1 Tax=Caballeronia novacaledonica TaxID=1544861 RepID=UPI000D123FAC|nr:ESPR-type extended signal peptide-containing protein [Caballeronia novacaledonica]
MNQNRYKLIFCRLRGLMVPVVEFARAHGAGPRAARCAPVASSAALTLPMADAACYLVQCAAQMADNNPDKAAALASQQRGAGYASEQSALKTGGQFVYNPSADAAYDALYSATVTPFNPIVRRALQSKAANWVHLDAR